MRARFSCHTVPEHWNCSNECILTIFFIRWWKTSTLWDEWPATSWPNSSTGRALYHFHSSNLSDKAWIFQAFILPLHTIKHSSQLQWYKTFLYFSFEYKYHLPLLVGFIFTQTSLLPLARTPSSKLASNESLKNINSGKGSHNRHFFNDASAILDLIILKQIFWDGHTGKAYMLWEKISN